MAPSKLGDGYNDRRRSLNVNRVRGMSTPRIRKPVYVEE